MLPAQTQAPHRPSPVIVRRLLNDGTYQRKQVPTRQYPQTRTTMMKKIFENDPRFSTVVGYMTSGSLNKNQLILTPLILGRELSVDEIISMVNQNTGYILHESEVTTRLDFCITNGMSEVLHKSIIGQRVSYSLVKEQEDNTPYDLTAFLTKGYHDDEVKIKPVAHADGTPVQQDVGREETAAMRTQKVVIFFGDPNKYFVHIEKILGLLWIGEELSAKGLSSLADSLLKTQIHNTYVSASLKTAMGEGSPYRKFIKKKREGKEYFFTLTSPALNSDLEQFLRHKSEMPVKPKGADESGRAAKNPLNLSATDALLPPPPHEQGAEPNSPLPSPIAFSGIPQKIVVEHVVRFDLSNIAGVLSRLFANLTDTKEN